MKSEELINKGVTVVDPARLDIRGEVKVGKDCLVDVNVIFEGNVALGDNVHIGPNTILKNVTIGNNSKIEAFSHLESATVGDDCVIGPYARLREGSNIENSAKVGNFVETKNTTLGNSSKANHFTYLGDTEVGTSTNIGAGTITCNYDGVKKNKTKIKDKVFIGSNSSLVAPVTINQDSIVGAGSVITKNVKKKSLALTRSLQTEVHNYKRKKK